MQDIEQAPPARKRNDGDVVEQLSLSLCRPSPRARAIDAAVVGRLAQSIDENGLLQPIVVRGIGDVDERFEVIAGLHRLEAFRRLGHETIPAIILDADDLRAELMLIDENLCRNDLGPAERAAAQSRRKIIWQQLHPETKKGGNQTGPVGQFGQTDAARYDEAAADATRQSERTIRRDVTRGEALGDEVLAKVAHTSLDKGDELDALAKVPAEKRLELVERAVAGGKVSAKAEVKKIIRAEREHDLGQKIVALPDGTYGVIVTDDEWDQQVWSRDTGMDRHAANHYETADNAHTAAEMHERTKDRFACAAGDCALFMWATVQHLDVAIDLLRLRGFKYVSHYAWGKDKIGLGYWNRNKHEILLIGVRGNVPCPAPGDQWDSLIMAPRGEHSAKPECFLEMIEQYFPTVPKIELNRRGPARPGWAAWGNQVEDHNGNAADIDWTRPDLQQSVTDGHVIRAAKEIEPGIVNGVLDVAVDLVTAACSMRVAAMNAVDQDQRSKSIAGLIIEFIRASNVDDKTKNILKKVFLPAIGHRPIADLKKDCGWITTRQVNKIGCGRAIFTRRKYEAAFEVFFAWTQTRVTTHDRQIDDDDSDMPRCIRRGDPACKLGIDAAGDLGDVGGAK